MEKWGPWVEWMKGSDVGGLLDGDGKVGIDGREVGEGAIQSMPQWRGQKIPPKVLEISEIPESFLPCPLATPLDVCRCSGEH